MRLYKLLCLFCIFTLLSTALPAPSLADEVSGKTASVYGYALNAEMYNHGVMTTPFAGATVENYASGGFYPSGVIYADIINFDKNKAPYLVVFRADSANACVIANVYGYDEKTAEVIEIVSLVKGYSPDEAVTGQFCIGYNDDERYIIYNEFYNGIKSVSEYYTVIDHTPFRYVCSPDYAQEVGIASFNCFALLPEVDISEFNKPLDNFFSGLKNSAGNSVTLNDISESVATDEEEKIETMLTFASRFNYLEIGDYPTLEEYNLALTAPDTDNKFYLITNLYDLGEEIYYVRFATNHSFYNYAFLRRTDKLSEGYQLLSVRTDSIPLSDVELESIKDVYTRNKLLMKKSRRGKMIDKNKPKQGTGNKATAKPITIEKKFDVPKVVNPTTKKAIALIGGGVCIALFVLLWIYTASSDDD